MREFEAEVIAEGEGGAWPCIWIPFDVEKDFGSKARVAVKGTINGHAYRSSIFPNGKGAHLMMLNKEMRSGASIGIGDRLQVTMEVDTGPREVTVPDDLREALTGGGMWDRFEKLTYSAKKLHVDAVEGAKKPETRAARIEKIVAALTSGSKNEGQRT